MISDVNGLLTFVKEHHSILGSLVDSNACTQTTASSMATSSTHHLRPSLDSLCVLLVSLSRL